MLKLVKSIIASCLALSVTLLISNQFNLSTTSTFLLAVALSLALNVIALWE